MKRVKDSAAQIDEMFDWYSEQNKTTYGAIEEKLETLGFCLIDEYQNNSGFGAIAYYFWAMSKNDESGILVTIRNDSAEIHRITKKDFIGLKGDFSSIKDSKQLKRSNMKRIKDDDYIPPYPTTDDDDDNVEWDINEDSEEMFEFLADDMSWDIDDAKKAVALGRFRGDSYSDVTYYDVDGNRINTDRYHGGQEYFVFDNHSDAEAAAIEDVKQLIDDMGLQSFSKSFQETIIDNYIEDDWFESAMQEYYQSYAEDISNESSDDYNNRLIEEAIENGVISEDDLDEDGEYKGDYYDLESMFAEEMCGDNAGYGSAAEWYRDMVGDEDFKQTVKQHDLIDWDKVAEESVRLDGVANSLARYDGYENEEKVDGTYYYIYRTD